MSAMGNYFKLDKKHDFYSQIGGNRVGQDTPNRNITLFNTSSHSHSGLMPPSVSVVLPALIVSNLFLVFSSVGVRFVARL